MIRTRLTACFSVLALTAGVACSSTDNPATTTATPEAGTPDAKTPKPTPDADGSVEDGSVEPTSSTACTTPDISKFTPPALKPHITPAAGACSAADLDTLKTCYKTANGDTAAVKACLDALPATCHSCVVSNEADASWGVFAETASGSFRLNQAGCLSLTVKKECGIEAFQMNACMGAACDDTTNCKNATNTEMGDCFTAVSAADGVCKAYVAGNECLDSGAGKLCWVSADTADARATTVRYIANLFCGGGSPVDAGAGDAGHGADSGGDSGDASHD